jgi:hypothetical protein
LTGSSSSTFSNNTILGDKTGVKLDKLSDLNVFTNNQIGNSTTAGLQIIGGSGTGTNANGTKLGNIFTLNNIHDNATKSIIVDDSAVAATDSNAFQNNTIGGAANQSITVNKSSGLLFANNTIGANVTFTLTGASANKTLVTFADQSKITLKVDAYSTAVFTSVMDLVIKAGNATTQTTLTPAGSTLTITSATIGTSAVLISARDIGAVPSSGSATIDATGWNSTPTATKSFVVRAANTTQSLTFTLGDLTPGGSYVVKKNNVVLATITAGSSGYASLTDIVGTTAATTYTLTPA